jgi:hypothetical protein
MMSLRWRTSGDASGPLGSNEWSAAEFEDFLLLRYQLSRRRLSVLLRTNPAGLATDD